MQETKQWFIIILLLAFLGLQSCIEPFELKTGTERQSLVVSGMVTDQNRPDLNKVTLSWTEPFDGERQMVLNRPVLGANVTLVDNSDNTMQFTEGSRGVYTLEAPAYKAELWRTYTLKIKLPDGREYASKPELLNPVPSIDDISYEFKRFTNVVRNTAGQLIERVTVGFEVKVAVQDPGESSNYYRWDTEGVFEYYSIPLIPTGATFIPASLCWATVHNLSTKAVTLDDRLINGSRFEQPIVVVPADMPTKYRVRVRQYALTPEAYEFWRLLNQQQNSTGSIFDPTPAQVRGNLFCKSNPEEQVIGYFGASGLVEQYIMIPRSLYVPLPGIPYEVPSVPYPKDCTSLYQFSTISRPLGF